MKDSIKKILKNRWVMITYVAVLIVFASYFFYIQRGRFGEILANARIHIILLSFIVGLPTTLLYPYINYIIYKGLGAEVSYWKTFRIIYLSRLGAYVPGRLWFASNFYVFSRKADIDSDKIGKNFIINNSFLFITGIICALPILYILPASVQKLFIVLPVAILILIHPKVLNRIINVLFLRGKSRENSQQHIIAESYSTYIKVFLLYMLVWCVCAVTMYVALLAFQPAGFEVLPVCLSASSSSLLVGLLAIFAPAGLGVREGIGLIVLTQVTSMETGILLMVVLRIKQVLTDLVCGIACAISIHREDRQRTLATNKCSDRKQTVSKRSKREDLACIIKGLDG